MSTPPSLVPLPSPTADGDDVGQVVSLMSSLSLDQQRISDQLAPSKKGQYTDEASANPNTMHDSDVSSPLPASELLDNVSSLTTPERPPMTPVEAKSEIQKSAIKKATPLERTQERASSTRHLPPPEASIPQTRSRSRLASTSPSVTGTSPHPSSIPSTPLAPSSLLSPQHPQRSRPRGYATTSSSSPSSSPSPAHTSTPTSSTTFTKLSPSSSSQPKHSPSSTKIASKGLSSSPSSAKSPPSTSSSSQPSKMTGLFYDARCVLHEADRQHVETPKRLTYSFAQLLDKGLWDRCAHLRVDDGVLDGTTERHTLEEARKAIADASLKTNKQGSGGGGGSNNNNNSITTKSESNSHAKGTPTSNRGKADANKGPEPLTNPEQVNTERKTDQDQHTNVSLLGTQNNNSTNNPNNTPPTPTTPINNSTNNSNKEETKSNQVMKPQYHARSFPPVPLLSLETVQSIHPESYMKILTSAHNKVITRNNEGDTKGESHVPSLLTQQHSDTNPTTKTVDDATNNPATANTTTTLTTSSYASGSIGDTNASPTTDTNSSHNSTNSSRNNSLTNHSDNEDSVLPCHYIDMDTYVNKHSQLAARIAATGKYTAMSIDIYIPPYIENTVIVPLNMISLYTYHSYVCVFTSIRICLSITIGVTALVRRVLDGDIANGFALVRPPGHHADTQTPSGFCLYNNIAVAATVALTEYSTQCQRVAIVDFDVHHGDGTQKCFYQDNNVLFISIHRYHTGFFPGTGAASETGQGNGTGYSVNIPFGQVSCVFFFAVTSLFLY